MLNYGCKQEIKENKNMSDVDAQLFAKLMTPEEVKETLLRNMNLVVENGKLKSQISTLESANRNLRDIIKFLTVTLELGNHAVNVPSVWQEVHDSAPKFTDFKCTCGCHDNNIEDETGIDEEDFKSVLKYMANVEKDKVLRKHIHEVLGEDDASKNEVPQEVPVENIKAETEVPVVVEEYPPEEAEPVESEDVKPRKKRKERGGSVFTDFETLTLDKDTEYEGNSVIHSSKL